MTVYKEPSNKWDEKTEVKEKQDGTKEKEIEGSMLNTLFLVFKV